MYACCILPATACHPPSEARRRVELMSTTREWKQMVPHCPPSSGSVIPQSSKQSLRRMDGSMEHEAFLGRCNPAIFRTPKRGRKITAFGRTNLVPRESKVALTTCLAHDDPHAPTTFCLPPTNLFTRCLSPTCPSLQHSSQYLSPSQPIQTISASLLQIQHHELGSSSLSSR